MKTLIIEELGGKPLGKVTQGSDGTIRIQADNINYEGELNEQINRIANAPLTLRQGKEEQTPDGNRKFVTIVRACPPSDPAYLHALADKIRQERITVAGRRIRGYVIED